MGTPPNTDHLPEPEQAEPTVVDASAWIAAVVQIVPTVGLSSIAIAALWLGGIDGKDVALSATSGLAGFAAARGFSR